MSAELIHALPSLVVAAGGGGGDNWNTLVDIVTVILCFFLVFWVLKRYAYGPILSAIDERRHLIDSDLKRAEDLRVLSEKDREEIEARLRGIEEESRQKMQELLNEGKRAADEIREKGRADAEQLLEKAKQNIVFETQKAREELKAEVVNLTILASEHLLKERLDDENQRRLIGDFLNRIERN